MTTEIGPRKRAMGSHHSPRAQTTTWLTPPEIVEALGPFDLDPCAAPSPRPWPTAAEHIELPRDGLAEAWHGRVWLNPPYSHAAWTWLSKLADHGDGIALVFARTETVGFVAQVWQRATAVLFLHGRLHFHFPDGERAPANSGAPSALVAYGADAAASLRNSGIEGTYVPLQLEEQLRFTTARTLAQTGDPQ
ncbi:DNA N-6-adenine-methyltransferase [Leucobacter sp. NPDC058333]|uniref:DNA N-6-adenine-methyltransferase n=1 Tax=Leucobacter sp. NPDC058333 TaxID=3346450 RepID=UPI003658B567